MYKLSLLVLVALTGYTLGQQTSCCTPNQWEGYIGKFVGVAPRLGRGRLHEGAVRFSYDFTNKKIAEQIYLWRRNITVNVIADFRAGKLYHFVKEKQLCKSRDIKVPFKQFCVPAEAKQLAKRFYFGLGSNKLTASSYAYRSPKGKFGVIADVAKVGSNCVPVIELVAGEKRRGFRSVRFVATIGFVNLTTGIKDPNVFIPPAYCKKTGFQMLFNEVSEEGADSEQEEFIVQYLHEKMELDDYEFV